MKTFLLGFIAAFLVFPTGADAYFGLGFAELPGDASPAAWEIRLMHSAVRASILYRQKRTDSSCSSRRHR